MNPGIPDLKQALQTVIQEEEAESEWSSTDITSSNIGSQDSVDKEVKLRNKLLSTFVKEYNRIKSEIDPKD